MIWPETSMNSMNRFWQVTTLPAGPCLKMMPNKHCLLRSFKCYSLVQSENSFYKHGNLPWFNIWTNYYCSQSWKRQYDAIWLYHSPIIQIIFSCQVDKRRPFLKNLIIWPDRFVEKKKCPRINLFHHHVLSWNSLWLVPISRHTHVNHIMLVRNTYMISSNILI